NANVELNLNHAGVEISLGHRTRGVLQQLEENIPGLVWLNDRIDPAARRTISDIGLFFVTLFHFRPKFFELFVCRFFITSFTGAGEDRKNGVGRLRSAHDGVARSGPSNNKSRIVSLSAHCVVASPK